jgi:hypothetical protein
VTRRIAVDEDNGDLRHHIDPYFSNEFTSRKSDFFAVDGGQVA